jgi:hypothetical protein
VSGRQGAEVSTRLLGATNAALGVAMLAWPRQVTRAVTGRNAEAGTGRNAEAGTGWVRLLGGRYVVQGAAQISWPHPVVLRGSAAVDGVHAASMLALAALRPDYRRPALASCAVATGLAAIAAWQSRS